MSVFTLDLSDDLRAKVEAYRVRRGLRSSAQAIRHMIDGAELPLTSVSDQLAPLLVVAGPIGQPEIVDTGHTKSGPTGATASGPAGPLRITGFDTQTSEPIYAQPKQKKGDKK